MMSKVRKFIELFQNHLLGCQSSNGCSKWQFQNGLIGHQRLNMTSELNYKNELSKTKSKKSNPIPPLEYPPHISHIKHVII